MKPRRANDPIVALSRRLAAAYCIACSLVFVITLVAVFGVWQVRSTAEAEAACSNILSLVLEEVSSSQSSDLADLQAFLDRPAFSTTSIRISGESGLMLESGAMGGGGTYLEAKAETQDGKQVDVEVSYDAASLITTETAPFLVVAIILVLVLVLVSCRWFVRSAVKPVARAIRQQREFVAAASHELRSPLSVIKLDLEVAKARAQEGDAAATCALVEEAEVECGNLSLLTDDLLALASGDAQGWAIERCSCDAEALFVEAFDGMDEKALSAGVTLVPDLP
ncbi:MAG: histidine kinase dimerization/phospho-acceptor domain-containing protein, partial [Raoultibacter sp.]